MAGKSDRKAEFCCALALKIPGKETVIAEGVCPGVILEARRGTGGFGYDPLFYIPAEGCTMAQLSPARKNQISHRARALSKFVEKVGEMLC